MSKESKIRNIDETIEISERDLKEYFGNWKRRGKIVSSLKMDYIICADWLFKGLKKLKEKENVRDSED